MDKLFSKINTNNSWILHLILALFSIIFGVVAILVPSRLFVLSYYFVALFFIVDGLLTIALSIFYHETRKKMFGTILGALLSILIGIIFIYGQGKLFQFAILLIAGKLLIENFSGLLDLIKLKKWKEKLIDIVKFLFVVLVAIYLMVKPFETIETLLFFLGIYSVIKGFIYLYETARSYPSNYRYTKEFRKIKLYILSALSHGMAYVFATLFFLIASLPNYRELLNKFGISGIWFTILSLTIVFIVLRGFGVIVGAVSSYLATRQIKDKAFRKALIGRAVLSYSLLFKYVFFGLFFMLTFYVAYMESRFSVGQLVIVFSIISSVFGLATSLLMFFKRKSQVLIGKIVTFYTILYAIAGGVLGFMVYYWYFDIYSSIENSYSSVWVLFMIFIYGFITGFAFIHSYFVTYDKQEKKKVIDEGNLNKESSQITAGIRSFFTSDVITKRNPVSFVLIVVLLSIGVYFGYSKIADSSSLADELPVVATTIAWIELYQDNIPDLNSYQEILENDLKCKDGIFNTEEFGVKQVKLDSCPTSYKSVVRNNEAYIIFTDNKIIDINSKVRNFDSILLSIVASKDSISNTTIIDTNIPKDFRFLIDSENNQLLLLNSGTNQFKAFKRPSYECNSDNLNKHSKALYDGYSSVYIEMNTFCNNRYEDIVYTPNPIDEFSKNEKFENGVFEYAANLIAEANYEVQYSQMWYDANEDLNSPGYQLAEGVATLYEKVKQNPDNYPRGVRVKILLGNPPELLTFETETQIQTLLTDLSEAGIDKMVDEEIGWSLEVANFSGFLPHSHVKTFIIDGETAIVAGFNASYSHFPVEHVSGKGVGRVDNGIQISGPEVQKVMAAFDDQWVGSNQRNCKTINKDNSDWQTTCTNSKAVVKHTPEVLTIKLPYDSENNQFYTDTAFSMYRSKNYKSADLSLENALRSSTKSMDIIQVNFSLKSVICGLNVFIEVCDHENGFPVYFDALIEAAKNGSHIRILTKDKPFEGLENESGIKMLYEVAEKEGVLDSFEVRFFDGDFHNKNVVIDNELLIVGSQNFHYSAWGKTGLTELNMATDNEEAIDEYNKYFEYYWDLGIPLE